jgi:hypothetical protein
VPVTDTICAQCQLLTQFVPFKLWQQLELIGSSWHHTLGTKAYTEQSLGHKDSFQLRFSKESSHFNRVQMGLRPESL